MITPGDTYIRCWRLFFRFPKPVPRRGQDRNTIAGLIFNPARRLRSRMAAARGCGVGFDKFKK